jgi:signal transduction histidine kinase
VTAAGDVAFAPRWWRITVAALVGTLMAVSVGAAVVDGYVPHRPAGAVVVAASLVLIGLVALLGRRRWPGPVLGVETAIAAGTSVLAGAGIHTGPVFFALLALYTYGTLRPPARTVVAAAASGLTVAVADCLVAHGLGPLVPIMALFTAVTAVSLYVRSQRALMVSYRERAEQAEHEQRWTAARAVAAERVRIARELHDIVAHHVSLLVIQAGAVRETLPADHITRPVLDSMIDGGRQAMGEMRDMLDALRFDDSGRGTTAPAPGSQGDGREAAGDSPHSPQPTAEQIPALVTGARAGGLPVTLHVHGTAVATPPATSLAAYRIVQEALTNALKHAPGAFTTVRVDYGPDALALSVRNGPAPFPPDRGHSIGPGHGLVGMRERATLARGTLSAGRTADGWEVLARLPLEPATRLAGAPPAPLPSRR